MFVNSGFEHLATRDITVNIEGRRTDVDSVFVYKNIIVFVEDTRSASDHVDDHIRKKAEFVRFLHDNYQTRFEQLVSQLPTVQQYVNNSGFEPAELHFRYVYCSQNDVSDDVQARYRSQLIFLQFAYLKYFLALSRTIRHSAKYELLKFLGFQLSDVGHADPSNDIAEWTGILIAETPSGFPTGHRLVSFLVDPATLLQLAYVLRADGWQDSDSLYQRLLIKNKIVEMRKYLVTEKRVFINNLIATLPSETEILNASSDELPVSPAPRKATPVRVRVPKRFNAIGIIDGQHRLFAYHEGQDDHETQIARLRERQNLLVTGIVYPGQLGDDRRQRFEAKLFLEINDKQNRVKGDLKQAIAQVVDPFSTVAIAKAVVEQMAKQGPLQGLLETHFYDVGKIKTTSIVSYGLVYVVSIRDRDRGFVRWWQHDRKDEIASDREVLRAYEQYCASRLGELFGAFKSSIDNSLWTTDKKVSRALTTTTINGLIYCMRLILEHGRPKGFTAYKAGFANLTVRFDPKGFKFKSSHWKDLGERVYKECFADGST